MKILGVACPTGTVGSSWPTVFLHDYQPDFVLLILYSNDNFLDLAKTNAQFFWGRLLGKSGKR
ncbi:MAG TPA: hypothetical protein VEI57_05685 [Nitrospirota bacterium]|nr:hypothetical protein [Nitrospirota bacterium]